MKGVVRLLAMTVLIVMVSAIVVPVLAESWQTRYGSNDIVLNTTGTCVSNIQSDLKKLGYSIVVTSTYNSETITVVKKFQRANGLTASGVFNDSTKIALWNILY